jgi:hypothetical protein
VEISGLVLCEVKYSPVLWRNCHAASLVSMVWTLCIWTQPNLAWK